MICGTYAIAVRELCEFTAKQGDLDLRFTPSPTAQEGIAGHAAVAARRMASCQVSYQTEVALSGAYRQLLVRGRADGYDPEKNQLEEIKTYRGDLARMPANHRNLHWAQAKMYGALLCDKLGLNEIHIALVYYDIGSQRETPVTELFSAAALKQFFEQQCTLFLAWAEAELTHRAARDSALSCLSFPHAAFRSGQRQLAEAIYKSAVSGRCLMAQAPTGIGKTIGTLFPLLKACPGQRIDKVFFLAAKTSGRALALDAVAQIRTSAPELPLRVIELVARDKACEHPDKACHGESCPLAKGFFDRLPAARSSAVAGATLDKATLRQVALAHQVCPYYLSQDLMRWADVVVGDYNYFLDLNAMLHGLSLNNQWRVSLLIDEAHNLIERARKMYSAELDQAQLKRLRRFAPAVLKKSLDRAHRQWEALTADQDDAYRVHAELPLKFLGSLQQVATAITDYLVENPTSVDAALQDFYFDALHFLHVAELFGGHSLFDVNMDARKKGGPAEASGSTLCIRNVVPAPFLAQRFSAAHSAALFSATLSPPEFYRDTLGLPEDTVWIDVESPFNSAQLSVKIVSHVSTRYQHRAASLAPIADIVANQYAAQPGNYMVFVSSFEYLAQLSTLFRERWRDIPLWEQARHMDEAAREEFLQRFTVDGKGIGFAVLGGAFGEGIDLPGERLIGAFIATLGLPQLNPVNEEIRKRMQANFGAGYAYTYLYPGLQKIVQAAGRVIRTQQDRGAIFLIDDRFGRPEVRRLMPRWWDVQQMLRAGDL